MADPDWRLLAPHRPLGPGDGAYVERPTGGGDAIAKWIEAGGSTVIVSGPTGVGKSTELAQAAKALAASRVACLVQVDRMANMHRLTANELMLLMTQRLVEVARAEQLPLVLSLVLASKAAEGLVEGDPRSAEQFLGSGASSFRAGLSELERRSQRRVALIIDGLEKLLPGPDAREIFDALSQLPESVDLIAVIPWHAAFGGGVEAVLRAGERWHRIAALPIEGDAGFGAAEFLGRVLARRLQNIEKLPEAITPLLGRAFKASGGIPRTFLQLMADAGTYARAKRGAAWPDESDLDEAIADQEQSFRRALLPGDTKAIQEARHTDGRELDVERRVRLLAQGILLERTEKGRTILDPHPLVAPAVAQARS